MLMEASHEAMPDPRYRLAIHDGGPLLARSCAILNELRLRLPHVEVIIIAGSSYYEIALSRCAIKSGADICLGTGQFGQRNLHGATRFQQIKVIEQLVNNLVVLAFAAERQITLRDGHEIGAPAAILRLNHSSIAPLS